MNRIKVAYLKLNLHHMVLEHNEHFVKLFNYELGNLPALSLTGLFRVERWDNLSIDQLGIGEQQSYTLFRNRKTKMGAETTVVVLYILVKRYKDHYTVKIINWLNWLYGVHHTLESAYKCINKFNHETAKQPFAKLSVASGFKALYPLITHIPLKFNGGIFPSAMAEIMQAFAIKRKTNYYSRDYARNIYSRIKTDLKNEYNLEYVDAIDLIHNNDLLNIVFDDEVSLANTELVHNLIFSNEYPDGLLNTIIEAMPVDMPQ